MDSESDSLAMRPGRYVNTQRTGFDGGELAFLDGDADRIVEPRCGRLVRAGLNEYSVPLGTLVRRDAGGWSEHSSE
jgi:hypothetical protein